MPEQRKEENAQLSFNLNGGEERKICNSQNYASNSPNIVSFVDSTTLSVRREAVRRVVQSGIFKLRSSDS